MVTITKKAIRAAAGQGINLSVLQKTEGGVNGSNLGGAFRLPDEFDSRLYAAQWAPKGEVQAYRPRQHLQNIDASADGWEVWTYPNDFEDKNLAGKPCEITDRSNGKTYVLMFRSQEVQQAVNYAYGQASKDRMNAEISGETVGESAPQDPGILTADRLAGSAEMRAEMARDKEEGRDVATFDGPRPSVQRVITKKKIKINTKKKNS